MPFISSMAAGKGGKIWPLGAKPAVIALVALTAGDAIDTFSWSAPNNNGLPITKYGYQTSTNNGSSWSTEVEVLTTSAVLNTQYSLDSYKVRVRAFNAAGWGEYSTISSSGTVAWTNNTGNVTPETQTDTGCSTGTCSESQTDTGCSTGTCSQSQTDTGCSTGTCSETQNCECGTQTRTRTSTRSRTRSRTSTRSRTRTRISTRSRSRTRSYQYYSRAGSTNQPTTYGAWTIIDTEWNLVAASTVGWSALSYGAWSISDTEWNLVAASTVGWSALSYGAWSISDAEWNLVAASTVGWGALSYGAWTAYGTCAGGTNNAITATGTYGGIYMVARTDIFGTTVLTPSDRGGCDCPMYRQYTVTQCSTTSTYSVTDNGCSAQIDGVCK